MHGHHEGCPIEGKSASSAGELEEYEDTGSTKLEDCSSMEVEMRNREMGVKNVKDGEVGWTSIVRRRRKKIARSEESESSGNLNVNNKKRSLVRHRKVEGILGIYIRENLKASR